MLKRSQTLMLIAPVALLALAAHADDALAAPTATFANRTLAVTGADVDERMTIDATGAVIGPRGMNDPDGSGEPFGPVGSQNGPVGRPGPPAGDDTTAPTIPGLRASNRRFAVGRRNARRSGNRSQPRRVPFTVLAPRRPQARATVAPRVGCRSGNTLFKAGRTRIFSVWIGRYGEEAIYGCSARVRRPRRLLILDAVGGDHRSAAGPRFGHRVLIEVHVYSEGGEAHADLGWWDERNGRARWGDVNGDWEIITAVIARDGALAVVAVGVKNTQLVAYMCRRERRLGWARVLARIPATEQVEPASLSISATSIGWRTRQDARGSVRRDESRCRSERNPAR